MSTEYHIYFKDNATETEELIFTTESYDRAVFGADSNFETKSSEGQVYIKLNNEVVYTCGA